MPENTITTTRTTPISVHGLTKQFGRIRAVEELTFDVRPGQITGFLGPNGAGKTTTPVDSCWPATRSSSPR
jgi:ABC-type branched-subunit amino acid transport system ATPase component